MANSYFKFKQFTIHQDRCAMKVTTDSCLFGAWLAHQLTDEHQHARTMLDIGTGTGLLTLMAAQKNPQLIIDCIEIDESAFIQAKENISVAGFKNEIRISHDNILNQKTGKNYDVIVSNPPFYENELKAANNQKNVAQHDAGLLLEDLLRVIKNKLNENGVFYLLIPYKRKDDIETLFRSNHLYASKKVYVSQSTKHEYFRILVEGKLQKQQPSIEKKLTICDDPGKYSSEFIALLEDYYIYL